MAGPWQMNEGRLKWRDKGGPKPPSRRAADDVRQSDKDRAQRPHPLATRVLARWRSRPDLGREIIERMA